MKGNGVFNMSCCHECGHRHTACHDYCDTYKAYKEERIDISRKIRADLAIRKYESDKHDEFVRKGFRFI